MIKVSKLADYAVVVMAALSEKKEARAASSAIAARTHLPEPTVSKVLKLLAKAGIVQSVRGAGGGYRLKAPPETISVAEIVTAVDGPIALTACVEASKEPCSYASGCPVHGRWEQVNRAVKTALEEVSLADMICFSESPVKTGTLKKEPRLRGENIAGESV